MSRYSFIKLSDGQTFNIQEMQRTVALKSKPLNMRQVLRFGKAESPVMVGITEDGRLYTSGTIAYSRRYVPGESSYTEWLSVLLRFGLIDLATHQRELNVHDRLADVILRRQNLENLVFYANVCGVTLDTETLNAAYAAAGMTNVVTK